MPERITRADVLRALSRHIGRSSGVTAARLAREITGVAADDYTLRCLRHQIEELRREGHHICAHPGWGYFIARDADELTATCEFLYQRAMCSLAQIAAMQRVSLPDLRGQLRLQD